MAPYLPNDVGDRNTEIYTYQYSENCIEHFIDDSACLKLQLWALRHSLHGWQLPNVCLHSVPRLRSNSSWNKHTLSNKRQRMFAEAVWHYPQNYCNQQQQEETINEWNNVSGLTTSPPLAHPFVLWASL